MRLMLVVQVLVISLYGELHMVIPPYPTNSVTDFHVPSLSLVRMGSIICLDRIILRMVWLNSTCRHICEICVSVRPYVHTTSTGSIAIECKNESYEIILIDIWSTGVISNLQFKIKSGDKQQENIYKGYPRSWFWIVDSKSPYPTNSVTDFHYRCR